MNFDFNPSLWFVCRLCQDVFPNTDKLKDHKLENHLGDCFTIKTIIFEEKFLDYGWTPENPHQHSTTESVLQKSSKQQQSSQIQDQECHDPVEKLKNPYVSLAKLTARQIHSALNKKSSEINESNNIGPSEDKTTPDTPSICNTPEETEIPFSTQSNSDNFTSRIIPQECPALVDTIVPKEEPLDEPEIEVLKHELPLKLEDGEFILASVETTADGTAFVQFQCTELYHVGLNVDATNATETYPQSNQCENQLEYHDTETDVFTSEDYFEDNSSLGNEFDTALIKRSEEPDSVRLVPLVLESQSEIETSCDPLCPPANTSNGKRIKKGQEKKPKSKKKNVQLKSSKNDKKTNPIKKSVAPEKDPVRVFPVHVNSVPQAEFKTPSEPNSCAEISHENIPQKNTKIPKNEKKGNKKTNPIKKSVAPKKDPVRVFPVHVNSVPQPELETVSESNSSAEIAHENIPQENTKIPNNKRKVVHLISSKITKKRKLESQPPLKKRKGKKIVSLDIDLELDLPLNQWLDKLKEKNPSNLILLDPDPSTLDHFIGVSAENPVRCKLCQKSFKFERKLRSHVIQCWSMSDAKQNYCHLCNKYLCNPKSLEHHTRVTHSAISFDIELDLDLDLPLNQWLDKQKAKNPSDLILLDPDPSTVDNFVGVSVENPVKCKLCQESFNSERNLRSHVICCWTMNKEKHRYCHLCNKAVYDPGYLKGVHNRIFHSTEPRTIFKCHLCSKEFLTKRGLLEHEAVHNPEKSYSCTICGKLYRGNYSLKHHMRSHSLEKTWKCDYDQSICQATFETKASLNRHRNTHQSVAESPKYTCPIPECGKTFVNNWGLTVHCRRHERNSCKATCGDAPCAHKEASGKAKIYECPQCSSTFKLKETRDRHMISAHGKETNYKCQDCGKYFIWKCMLEAHSSKHMGDHPFKCEVANCSKSFVKKFLLTKHLNERHKVQVRLKNHLCPICGKGFLDKYNLTNHIKFTHKQFKPFECDSCSQKFKGKQQLDEHVRVAHTGEMAYQCDKCGKSYARKLAFVLHLRGHEGPLKRSYISCSLCPRKFGEKHKYERHLLAHERGENFYFCQFCDFQSTFKSAFTKHERSHAKKSDENETSQV